MSDIITACVAGGSGCSAWDGYHPQRITLCHTGPFIITHGAEVQLFPENNCQQDTNSGWANGENGGPTKTQAGVCNLELLL